MPPPKLELPGFEKSGGENASHMDLGVGGRAYIYTLYYPIVSQYYPYITQIYYHLPRRFAVPVHMFVQV